MSFFARFSNINLEMDQALVTSFLEQIEKVYRYEWISDKEVKTLIIHGEEIYELPFIEKENSFTLSIQELIITEKTFSLPFNQLLFEARKKRLGIININERKKQRAEKKLQDIIEIRTRKKEQEKKESLAMSKQTKEYVTKFEINYLLMDLYEALEINDDEKITFCKQRLQELVREKGS
ncbi:hypothetical protein ACFFHM_13650 [Halalkalibacter kiskunsagensis]|uniref:Uncharacterized protein n=1 Tax=Halalkalibacter kiskunsagensis TaxID=1548599 RepID=A0ABV6KHM5_9BACI